MIIISNTSPITSLAAIGRLELLQQLYDTIIIPEAVYRELTEVESPVPGTLEVQTLDWIEVRQLADSSIISTLFQQPLDPGESEAIALAIELNAELLLIDERRGRTEANRLGVTITGLLGILTEAKNQALIEAVKPLLDNLINTAKFRVSERLYALILETVGEQS